MVNIARIGRLQGAAMDLTQWLETLPENPSLALAVVAGLSVAAFVLSRYGLARWVVRLTARSATQADDVLVVPPAALSPGVGCAPLPESLSPPRGSWARSAGVHRKRRSLTFRIQPCAPEAALVRAA